jgi:hypothetical protein
LLIVLTIAQADAKADEKIFAHAAPSSLPSWVLKNPNSVVARDIMRRSALKKKSGGDQVWCGAYVCDE